MLLPQKTTIKKRKQMQNLALISVHLIHHYSVLFDCYLIFNGTLKRSLCLGIKNNTLA